MCKSQHDCYKSTFRCTMGYYLSWSMSDSLIQRLFPFQMSSFIFFVISPIMLYLLHPYAKERNLAVHLVWIMMVFVGKCEELNLKGVVTLTIHQGAALFNSQI